MDWRTIVNSLKQLDERLSDAVYFHGCVLTGIEKLDRPHCHDEIGDGSQRVAGNGSHPESERCDRFTKDQLQQYHS